MKITINGDEVDAADGLTVAELLKARQVKMPEMVTVELNGEIVDRAAFGRTPVKTGDTLEFLYFMGGGAGPGRFS